MRIYQDHNVIYFRCTNNSCVVLFDKSGLFKIGDNYRWSRKHQELDNLSEINEAIRFYKNIIDEYVNYQLVKKLLQIKGE